MDVATLMVPGSQSRPHHRHAFEGKASYSKAKLRLPTDVMERCATGLSHVAEGLRFLEQFTVRSWLTNYFIEISVKSILSTA